MAKIKDVEVAAAAVVPKKEQTVRAVYCVMEDPTDLRKIGMEPEPLGKLTKWIASQANAGKLVIE